ncbi:GNAT family N-acetyltransferase [Aestuariivivens sediminicola]|uniref:GNAT family N-acetyltransferase n=1 Tax=Aestuariivivens sediminicola TaxID=2913560 RepID=UPI001F5612B2|nr:GNAT family protein [Aestuariivivens sediminicola]
MITLKGEHIFLRALEPEDLELIFSIENNETFWEISNTQTPYSRYMIKQYLDQAHKDIFEVKQLRLVISNYDREAMGLIDIFDYDFKNARAGVGILIKDENNRSRGYGKEALKILMNYCFSHLNLHQLYCNVSEDNEASLKLFASLGFRKVGLKRDWNRTEGYFKNEYMFQFIDS